MENNKFDKLLEILDNTDQNKWRQIRELPPIKEWVYSKYHMGGAAESLYPYWRDTLVEFFDSDHHYTELILSGSTGTGKSHAAILVQFRLMQELTCYDYPALFFNLDRTSVLLFFYLCTTQSQALKTGFGKLQRLIDQSPYFNEFYKRDQISSMIRFPNNKIVGGCGSEASDFIGEDLFSIILDEANFLHASGGERGYLTRATGIYREATNRRKNRFIKGGKEFGASIIVSSSDSQSSFTEQRIQDLKNDPTVLIKSTRAYDIKPEDYCGKRFWVFTGDTQSASFIVEPNNKDKFTSITGTNDLTVIPLKYKEMFVDVPIEYKNTFELDIYNSLKEVAGVSMSKKGSFFNDVDSFNKCINRKLPKPFNTNNITISTADKRNNLIRQLSPNFKGNPNYNYYFALDLSSIGCNTGIGMGHLFNNKCTIDLMLGVKPPVSPGRINFNHIKEFVKFLIDQRDFNIIAMITDTWNCEEILQYFNNLKIKSFTYSVEREEPYLFFTNKISTQEMEFYDYDLFRTEVFNLEYEEGTKKVGHPKNPDEKTHLYSKDVTDVVCRIVNNLYLYEPYNTSKNKKGSGLLELMKRQTKTMENSYKDKDIIKIEEKLLGGKLERSIK